MALIKCTECDRDISDAAAACPGCGHPLKPNARSSKAPTVGTALILAAAALGLLGTCIYMGGDSSTTGDKGSSTWESFQKSSDPAAMLTKRCAAEAGIPANDPKHRITPQEMSGLTSCIDRNK